MQFAYEVFTNFKTFVFSRADIKFSRISLQFVLAILLFTSCNDPLTVEKSRKHLVAADHELTTILKRIFEADATKALMRLYENDSAPMPGRFYNNPVTCEMELFQLEKQAGYYQEDDSGNFKRIRASDSLIINFVFNHQMRRKALFVLSKYEEAPTAFNGNIPTLAEGYILIEKKKVLEFYYETKLKYGFPEISALSLNIFPLQIEVNSTTRFGKKRSKVSLTATIAESEKQLFETTLNTSVSITEQRSLVFGKKDLKIKVFPIIFHLTSDYPFEGMPAVSFVEDFNRMSKMRITNFHGQEVANVYFATIPGRDRVNLYAHFVDGSKEDLEQIMILVEKILNIKYQFPV